MGLNNKIYKDNPPRAPNMSTQEDNSLERCLPIQSSGINSTLLETEFVTIDHFHYEKDLGFLNENDSSNIVSIYPPPCFNKAKNNNFLKIKFKALAQILNPC